MKAGTNIHFSDNVLYLAQLTPGIGLQQYDDFVYSYLVTCTKYLSDTIKKNSFVTRATKQKGTTDPNIVKMKDTDFNKLKAATTIGLSETEVRFSNELTSFPECVTGKRHKYHVDEVQAL